MRRPWALLVGLALTFGTASLGHAAAVEWEGTLTVNVGTLGQFIHYGTGVATVNGSAGAFGHINTLRIASGLSFTGGNNVPETIRLVTDPWTPLLTLMATGMRVGKVTFTGPTTTHTYQQRTTVPAEWNGISGGPPLGSKNTGRPPGGMKVCILFPGCSIYLPIPFGTPNGQAVGIGGMVTVNTFSKKAGGFKLSMQGAPWSIGLASIKNVTTTCTTPNGGTAVTTYTKTLQGFVHGPASGTSTTAVTSGLLQLVTPVFVQTNLGTPDTFQAWWFEVKLHFIPEPGLALLLGSGVAGLLLLGRSRTRGS